MKVPNSLLVSVFIASLWSCNNEKKNKEGLLIKGEVEQIVPNGWVLLEKIEEQGASPLDTASFGPDGSYELIVEIEEPSFYRLNFNGRQHVTLILTGMEEEVVVNASGNDPQGFSEVSGSYDTEYMLGMDNLLKTFQADMQRINQEAIQARSNGDLVAFQATSQKYQLLAQKNNDQMKQMVWESLPSLAALYGIQQLDPDQNFFFFDSVSAELSRELPNNYMVENLKQMVKARGYLGIGAEAPEIALPNPEGEIVKLSSLKGNYVLIDFWAAWCRPCRVENPNVVRVYNQYQDKNFEILGVSLDRKKDAWVAAIEQDGLAWKHISDLKYFSSAAAKTYQISAIPATYLIDPEGKIMAKNLRGSSLIAKLKEIFEQ